LNSKVLESGIVVKTEPDIMDRISAYYFNEFLPVKAIYEQLENLQCLVQEHRNLYGNFCSYLDENGERFPGEIQYFDDWHSAKSFELDMREDALYEAIVILLWTSVNNALFSLELENEGRFRLMKIVTWDDDLPWAYYINTAANYIRHRNDWRVEFCKSGLNEKEFLRQTRNRAMKQNIENLLNAGFGEAEVLGSKSIIYDIAKKLSLDSLSLTRSNYRLWRALVDMDRGEHERKRDFVANNPVNPFVLAGIPDEIIFSESFERYERVVCERDIECEDCDLRDECDIEA